jgi:hypothetical protein
MGNITTKNSTFMTIESTKTLTITRVPRLRRAIFGAGNKKITVSIENNLGQVTGMTLEQDRCLKCSKNKAFEKRSPNLRWI